MPLSPLPRPTTTGDAPAAGGSAPSATPEIVEPLCAVFRRQLKADNQKYTPERAAILDAVIQLDGLFEADQLYRAMKDSNFGVSRATVYRTLNKLEECGIVQKVLFDKDQRHYQLAYGHAANTVLVRVDTGEVEAVEAPGLAEICERLCRQRGLRPEGLKLQIFAAGDDRDRREDGALG